MMGLDVVRVAGMKIGFAFSFVFLLTLFSPLTSAAQYHCVNPYTGAIVVQSTPCTPDCIFGDIGVNGYMTGIFKEIEAQQGPAVIDILRRYYQTTFDDFLKTGKIISQGDGYVFAQNLDPISAAKIVSIANSFRVDSSINRLQIAQKVLRENRAGKFGGIANLISGIRGANTGFSISSSELSGTLGRIYEIQQRNPTGGVKIAQACKCGAAAYGGVASSRAKTSSGFCCVVKTGNSYSANPASNDCKEVAGGYIWKGGGTIDSSFTQGKWISFPVGSEVPNGQVNARAIADASKCFKYERTQVYNGQIYAAVFYNPSTCDPVIDFKKQSLILEFSSPTNPSTFYQYQVSGPKKVTVVFKVDSASTAAELDAKLKALKYNYYTYAITIHPRIANQLLASEETLRLLPRDTPASRNAKYTFAQIFHKGTNCLSSSFIGDLADSGVNVGAGGKRITSGC